MQFVGDDVCVDKISQAAATVNYNRWHQLSFPLCQYKNEDLAPEKQASHSSCLLLLLRFWWFLPLVNHLPGHLMTQCLL